MATAPESQFGSTPLYGKTAVIVGGGRGMGRATALKLASAGARVVVAARTKTDLDGVVSEIGQLGGSAESWRVDATSAVQLNEFAIHLGETYGQVDVLIYTAGVAFIAPFRDTSEADWDRVIRTNLKGAYLCVYAFHDLLKASGMAQVVFIASKVGLTGHARVTAYTAAKAGLIGFSKALAQELRSDHIRVTCLCPGPVDTPMRWEATPEMDPKMAISSETIADAVLFLTTLEKNATSGEIILEALAYEESAVPLDK